MSIVKFNALECTQNNQTFLLTILPNDILKEVCFVSRRDEDPIKGFQRSLNESRARDIAKYLDNLNGVIPSALILSAQPNAKLNYDKKSSQIRFETHQNSFMVLDGQHRLYGLIKAEKTYQMPVIIFNDLNATKEVTLFIDINTTQKGVPTTLLLDIKNLSGRETKKEDLQRQLFDKLNTDSVLAGLLSPAKSKVGKITRVSFNQATNELFENGFFHNKESSFSIRKFTIFIITSFLSFVNLYSLQKSGKFASILLTKLIILFASKFSFTFFILFFTMSA